jgi:hypothetical protein
MSAGKHDNDTQFNQGYARPAVKTDDTRVGTKIDTRSAVDGATGESASTGKEEGTRVGTIIDTRGAVDRPDGKTASPETMRDGS